MFQQLTERRNTARLRESERQFQTYKRVVNVLTGHPADLHKDNFRFRNQDGSLMFPDID